jgi:hypothetical protein
MYETAPIASSYSIDSPIVFYAHAHSATAIRFSILIKQKIEEMTLACPTADMRRLREAGVMVRLHRLHMFCVCARKCAIAVPHNLAPNATHLPRGRRDTALYRCVQWPAGDMQDADQ